MDGEGRLGRGDVESRLGDAPDLATISALMEESAGLTVQGHKALHDAMVHPPYLWKQAHDIPESTTFLAARALVEADGLVRLRVIYTSVALDCDSVESTVAHDIESFGGSLYSIVEVAEQRFASVMNYRVLEVKRRFTGTRDEYLEKYVYPRADPRSNS